MYKNEINPTRRLSEFMNGTVILGKGKELINFKIKGLIAKSYIIMGMIPVKAFLIFPHARSRNSFDIIN